MITLNNIKTWWNHEEEKKEINRLSSQLIEVTKDRDFWKKEFDILNDSFTDLWISKSAHRDKYSQQRKRKKKGKANLKAAQRL